MIDNSLPPMSKFYTEAKAKEMVAEERAKWLKCIEDIKAKIEDEIDEEFDLCVRHCGRDVLRLTCLKEFSSLIDRKVNEVKDDREV